MLRFLGVRSKILAVLALPIILLMIASGLIINNSFEQSQDAKTTADLAELAPGLSKIVDGIQGERAVTLLSMLSPDPQRKKDKAEARALIDAGLQQLRTGTDSLISIRDPNIIEARQQVIEAHDSLVGLRAEIDDGKLTPQQVNERYTEIIALDIALMSAVEVSQTESDLADLFGLFTDLEQVSEYMWQEILVSLRPGITGQIQPAERASYQEVSSLQAALRVKAQQVGDRYRMNVPGLSPRWTIVRDAVWGNPDTSKTSAQIDLNQATALQEEIQNAITPVQDKVAEEVQVRANVQAEQKQRDAVIIGAVVAVVTLLSIVLAIALAWQIATPLRKLTRAAEHIRNELPVMVERMQTPGEGAEGIELPHIPVRSRDEVGRLADAFNEVNATTVQTAQEQAALRGSIAAMFVNVARRDQVLLGRQLQFIDKLERTEESPETLEKLFKLDHLATRMRRNAESLLVLAGIETGRRLRNPMALSDVVRTASSEIEDYERIDLQFAADPPVMGHHALSTAHLIAELLENGTRFSNPGTRVTVTGGVVGDHFVLKVTDQGLGLSDEELVVANQKINSTHASDFMNTDKLGLYVVGRLARKLDARVELQHAAQGGIVSQITMPASLFVPNALDQVLEKTPEAPASSGPEPQQRTLTPLPSQSNSEALPEQRTSTGLPVRGGSSGVPAPASTAPSAPGSPQPGGPDAAPPKVRARSGLFSNFRGTKDAIDETAASETPFTPSNHAGNAVAGTGGLPLRRSGTEAPANGLTARGGDSPAPLASRTPQAPTDDQPSAPLASRKPAAQVAPPEAPPVPGPDAPAPLASRKPAGEKPSAPIAPVPPTPSTPEFGGTAPGSAATPDTSAPAPAFEGTAPAAPSAPAPAFGGPPPAAPAPSAPNSPADPPPAASTPVFGSPAPASVPAPSGGTGGLGDLRSVQQPTASAVDAPQGEKPTVPAAPAPTQPQKTADILPNGGGRKRGFFSRRKPKAPQPDTAPATGAALHAPTPADTILGSATLGSAAPSAGASPASSAPRPLPSRQGAAPQPTPSSTLPNAAPASDGPATPNFGAPAAPNFATPPAAAPAEAAQASTIPAQPTATSAPKTVPAPAVKAPGVSVSDAELQRGGATLRQRSMLASQALSELSMLSSYSPENVQKTTGTSLQRRARGESAAGKAAVEHQAQAEAAAERESKTPKARNAAEVRSLLSGFQAGVKRGRGQENDAS